MFIFPSILISIIIKTSFDRKALASNNIQNLKEFPFCSFLISSPECHQVAIFLMNRRYVIVRFKNWFSSFIQRNCIIRVQFSKSNQLYVANTFEFSALESISPIQAPILDLFIHNVITSTIHFIQADFFKLFEILWNPSLVIFLKIV